MSAPGPRLATWQDAPAQAWRNGGGVTRELMAWPVGDDWRVRISVADIDRDGPFSAFPGVARWFAVLAGAGVELGLPAGPQQLRCGDEACAFDGADAPTCRLLDGSTRDLNLMLRGIDGGMRRADAGVPWQPARGQCGVFSREAGRVQIEHADGSGDDIAAPAMSLLWWDAAPARLVWLADDTIDGAARASSVPTPTPTPTHAWWLAAVPCAG